jgi:hypothetical protein
MIGLRLFPNQKGIILTMSDIVHRCIRNQYWFAKYVHEALRILRMLGRKSRFTLVGVCFLLKPKLKTSDYLFFTFV